MRYKVKTVFILFMIKFIVLSSSLEAWALELTTTTKSSFLTPLIVDKDQVRLRALPSLDAPTKTLVQEGTLLLAEKPMVHEQDSAWGWYKAVGIIDNKTGMISSRLAQGQFIPAYVSSTLVQEISWVTTGFEESFIFEQWGQGAYGQGYDLAQKFLAEQPSLDHEQGLWADASFKDNSGQGLIPIYKTPSTSGEMVNTEVTWEDLQENHDAVSLLVLDQHQQDWVLVVDQQTTLPAGWMESKLVKVFDFNDQEQAYLNRGYFITLDLGAHIPEIMHRWGPGEIVSRQVLKDWHGSGERTILSFDGLELEYDNYRNFKFILTRKNTGLGGIYIDTSWCNQDYIENIFGSKIKTTPQVNEGKVLGTKGIIEKSINNGLESWSFSYQMDSWTFELKLKFNDQGLVQEFAYQALDIHQQ